METGCIDPAFPRLNHPTTEVEQRGAQSIWVLRSCVRLMGVPIHCTRQDPGANRYPHPLIIYRHPQFMEGLCIHPGSFARILFVGDGLGNVWQTPGADKVSR